VTSGKRLVAIVSLAALVLLAASPAGIGIAALAVVASCLPPEACAVPQVGPALPRPGPGAIPLVPSRAPPLA
jgi:hypothetical protein